MTVRTLAALLLAALPLLAQEAPKEPEPGKPEDRTATGPASDEIRSEVMLELGAKPAGDELAKLVRKLEAALDREDHDAVRAALAELRAATKPGQGVGARLVLRPTLIQTTGMKDSAHESMSGSFTDEGRFGTYTLRSTGQGMYTLDATIRGSGGEAEVSESGTLGTLREKYPWLRGDMLVFRDSVVVADPAGRLVALDAVSGKARWEPVGGMLVRPPSDELRHHLEVPVGGGLVVEKVEAGSRADKLGLKRFDLLLRIDGELVEDVAQLRRLDEKGVVLEFLRRARERRLVTE